MGSPNSKTRKEDAEDSRITSVGISSKKGGLYNSIRKQTSREVVVFLVLIFSRPLLTLWRSLRPFSFFLSFFLLFVRTHIRRRRASERNRDGIQTVWTPPVYRNI